MGAEAVLVPGVPESPTCATMRFKMAIDPLLPRVRIVKRKAPVSGGLGAEDMRQGRRRSLMPVPGFGTRDTGECAPAHAGRPLAMVVSRLDAPCMIWGSISGL